MRPKVQTSWLSKFSKLLLIPFEYSGGKNIHALILIIAINSIVAFNAISHDPAIMYDANGHYANIKAYSEFRFPTRFESHEYHSGPLPYLIPAMTFRLSSQGNLGGMLENAPANSLRQLIYEKFLDSMEDPNLAVAGKVGQLQLVIVSLLLCYSLANLTKLIHPNHPAFQTLTLLLLGVLPAYYRSFAFIRGEPFIALWAVLFGHYALKTYLQSKDFWRNSIFLGIVIGLATLSRQFGAFLGVALLPFAFLFGIRRAISWKRIFLGLAVTASIAVAFGGTFYFQYYVQNNNSFKPSHKSFSRYPLTLSLDNLPPSFYYSLSLDELFVDPVRPSYSNQFIPRFYSDTFGDYSGHFLIYGWDSVEQSYITPSILANTYSLSLKNEGTFPSEGVESNRIYFGRYLGTIMIIALLPFSLFVAGWTDSLLSVFAKGNQAKPSHELEFQELSFWIISLNMLGLLMIAIMMASYDASTVKASYVIQIFPFAALLASDHVLRSRRKYITTRSVLIGLYLFFILSFPTHFTNYITWIR